MSRRAPRTQEHLLRFGLCPFAAVDEVTAIRLAGRGFAPARPFARMVLGRQVPIDDPRRIFATAGPELG